ncbi:helix-turn-helix domain-containing protein [Salimicrobium halophilum]|uniref:DNA binding domain-containing protein, excisionase family n=1 Tax=Salimicrobium halophilum TaxID=86666 RepID=A0A1G8WF90_9BACI|nr:helix-turn-helix domain-containing protein [Salimicrobium halophilum]SDJ76948.1 DNA binding domain-containing protein, excisionase family [Salimicrobium halophilum]
MKRTDVKGLVKYLEETGNKLSKSFIYRLVKQNRIPHKKIGSKIIFDIDSIERWLDPESEEGQDDPESTT